MDIEEIKKELIQNKLEIEIILKEIENNMQNVKEDVEIEPSDIAEQFEEKQDYHIKQEILKQRIEAINKSLRRIETGSYGICEKCGKEIERSRIKIDPTTEICRSCAA